MHVNFKSQPPPPLNTSFFQNVLCRLKQSGTRQDNVFPNTAKQQSVIPPPSPLFSAKIICSAPLGKSSFATGATAAPRERIFWYSPLQAAAAHQAGESSRRKHPLQILCPFFLLQRGKFHGFNSPALLFPPICRGVRRFLSSSCKGGKEMEAMEYLHECFGWRIEEKKSSFHSIEEKGIGKHFKRLSAWFKSV